MTVNSIDRQHCFIFIYALVPQDSYNMLGLLVIGEYEMKSLLIKVLKSPVVLSELMKEDIKGQEGIEDYFLNK